MESLAVKYRPKTFEEICGQGSIRTILTRQIENKEFKNSYLFCGSSGCGKTTTARAFARMINRGLGSPIEIDAASNNGVDNVRSIIKEAKERSLDSEYKIYILDEVHALTNTAWQAMLKLIEEPPKYTIFIFCTTDPQKIPATIQNRVMRFNFTRIPLIDIEGRLKYICKCEGFTNYVDSCEYISTICKGQMRDAISLLEKASSLDKNMSIEKTQFALGNVSYKTLFNIVNAVKCKDPSTALSVLEETYMGGCDVKLFVDELLTFCVDVEKYILMNSMDIIQIPKSFEDGLKYITSGDNMSQYYCWICDQFLKLKNMIKNDSNPKNTVEVCILQMCK